MKNSKKKPLKAFPEAKIISQFQLSAIKGGDGNEDLNILATVEDDIN